MTGLTDLFGLPHIGVTVKLELLYCGRHPQWKQGQAPDQSQNYFLLSNGSLPEKLSLNDLFVIALE